MYLDVFFTTSPMEEWEEWDGISMCEKKIAAHFLTISYIYIRDGYHLIWVNLIPMVIKK